MFCFPLLGQYAEAKADLQLATDYLKEAYAVELHSYTGDNVHYILNLLQPPRLEAVSTSDLHSPPEVVSDDVIIPASGPASPSDQYGTLQRLKRRHRRPETVSRSSPEIVSDDDHLFSASGPSPQIHGTLLRRRRSQIPHALVDNEHGRLSEPEPEVNIEPEAEESDYITYRSMPEWNDTAKAKYAERYTYVTRLLKIAHGLHYVGIGILAVFVVQVGLQLSIKALPLLLIL